MNPKYEHNETLWYNTYRKVQERIRQIEVHLQNDTVCDKMGNQLEIGDKTNVGVIVRFEGKSVITSEGKTHWSYVKKLEI